MDAILNRRGLTALDRFKSSPLRFLARLIHVRATFPTAKRTDQVRVICISDTHNSHNSQPPLPDGDILIHSGDLTQSGSQKELDNALAWLHSQPHPHKFFIAGNHDSCLVQSETRSHVSSTFPALTYLQDTSAEIIVRGRTLRVYGSPQTPKNGSWFFQYPRVHSPSYPANGPTGSASVWSSIPLLTDILITHGPPFAHLDLGRLGCYGLLSALWRVRPRLHTFGHIHTGRGVEYVKWDQAQRVYEDIYAGRSGWDGLVKLAWWTLIGLWWNGNKEGGTVLVNAAAVAGLKDEQIKGAILVEM